jgi:hypothetical protein
MVEFTIPLVLDIIRTAGILVAIVYYITIMRNQQRTRELSLKAQEEAEKARQREMIIQRSQTYGLDWMRAWNEINKMTDWEDAEDFAEKYSGTESRAQWMYIMRQYTLAGLHLKEGADPDLLFQLYPPYSIITLWERFEPVFRRQRDPNVWGPFEYLYTEAKKRYPDVTPGL